MEGHPHYASSRYAPTVPLFAPERPFAPLAAGRPGDFRSGNDPKSRIFMILAHPFGQEGSLLTKQMLSYCDMYSPR